MRSESTISEAFSCSELFNGLDPKLIRAVHIAEFRRGEPVGENYNGVGCVGIVASGSLSVETFAKNSVSVMKRGGEFGICNIFVNGEMPTKLTARIQSKIVYIPKEEFARLLAADSALMYRYVRLCNEKMLYLAERLRLISIPDSTDRLFHYLLTHSENGAVRLGISKDELARQLGVSRSSLFRALSSLESRGEISLSSGTIFLKPDGANT